MKNRIRAITCLVFLSYLNISLADDSRIRTEIYDKNKVYDLYTSVGRASLIQLEDDESLTVSPSSVLGIGDADAWNLGVRGNNIVLKSSQKMPRTNIVIVTNKRTYTFELLSAPKTLLPTYVLRFRYLDTEAAKERAEQAEALLEAQRVKITAAAKAEPIQINTTYVWKGSEENQALKPTAAYDDGRFTHLVYDHAGALPLFFKVMPDGTEALINSNIDTEHKNTTVLHEVVPKIRARLNDQVIEIINRNYTLPKFNNNGTSVHGTVRIEKE